MQGSNPIVFTILNVCVYIWERDVGTEIPFKQDAAIYLIAKLFLPVNIHEKYSAANEFRLVHSNHFTFNNVGVKMQLFVVVQAQIANLKSSSMQSYKWEDSVSNSAVIISIEWKRIRNNQKLINKYQMSKIIDVSSEKNQNVWQQILNWHNLSKIWAFSIYLAKYSMKYVGGKILYKKKLCSWCWNYF